MGALSIYEDEKASFKASPQEESDQMTKYQLIYHIHPFYTFQETYIEEAQMLKLVECGYF